MHEVHLFTTFTVTGNNSRVGLLLSLGPGTLARRIEYEIILSITNGLLPSHHLTFDLIHLRK